MYIYIYIIVYIKLYIYIYIKLYIYISEITVYNIYIYTHIIDIYIDRYGDGYE